MLFSAEVFSNLPFLLLDKWNSVLSRAYSEPDRCYHTLKHIESMLSLLDEAKSEIVLTQFDLQILQLAILFHDVTYKVPSETGYNETSSALLFQEFATEASLVSLLLEHCP